MNHCGYSADSVVHLDVKAPAKNLEILSGYLPSYGLGPLVTPSVSSEVINLRGTSSTANYNADGLRNKIGRSFLSHINYGLFVGLAISVIEDREWRLWAASGLTAASLAYYVAKYWEKSANDSFSYELATKLSPTYKKIADHIKSLTQQIQAGPNSKEKVQKMEEFHKNLTNVSQERLEYIRKSFLSSGFSYDATQIILKPLELKIEECMNELTRALEEKNVDPGFTKKNGVPISSPNLRRFNTNFEDGSEGSETSADGSSILGSVEDNEKSGE